MLGLGPDPFDGPSFGLAPEFTPDAHSLDQGLAVDPLLPGGQNEGGGQFGVGNSDPANIDKNVGGEGAKEGEGEFKSQLPLNDVGSQAKMAPTDNEIGISPTSLVKRVKQAFWTLASKLGYVRRPSRLADPATSGIKQTEEGLSPSPVPSSADKAQVNTSPVNGKQQDKPGGINVIVHNADNEDEEHFEFECMSDANTPILDGEGRPVTVSQPQDCHKYFVDWAAFAEPETVFFQEARKVFKSKQVFLHVYVCESDPKYVIVFFFFFK